MEWYRYDPETFEYQHPVLCQPNPARPGEFLIPPSATDLKPPKANQHEAVVFQKETNEWVIKPDYRDTEYWLADGSHHTITNIGETLPAAALDSDPTLIEPDAFQTMKTERDFLLTQSDWIITRQADQQALGMTPTTLSDEGYQQTLKWRQALRDMVEHPTQPTNTQGKQEQQLLWAWPKIPKEIKCHFPDYPPISHSRS